MQCVIHDPVSYVLHYCIIKFWLNVNQVCVQILNVFHFGNFLNEFHHALQFWLDFIIVQIFHNVLQSWSGWTVSIYILMMEFLTSSPNQPTHPPTNEPGSRDAIASKNFLLPDAIKDVRILKGMI